MVGKILYIEDDPLNQHVVRVILTQAGYDIFEASDGIQGIEVAAREMPDLILMDIRLPRMDGAAVTSRLKTIPELANIPVVAITAHTHADDIETYYASGCSGYIGKPITRDSLLNAVASFMQTPPH